MRHLGFGLVLYVLCALPAAASRPLPDHLQVCFNQAVNDMLIVDGRDQNQVWQLFLRHIDHDRLGRRAFGRAWTHTGERWRSLALRTYFDTIYRKGMSVTHGMEDPKQTQIYPRLADFPEPIVDEVTTWQIAATIRLDNGTSFSVAILMTQECKAIDFSQGGWVSGLMDAGLIDRLLRQR